jgi:uncharacterized protein YndB with AHSA1/START domain
MDDSERTTVEAIRRSLTVTGAPERAFTLFTREMGSWWPLDLYSRAVNEFEAGHVTADRLEFQSRRGGSVMEHLSDGQILPWAEVTIWEPPHRVVLAWSPHSLPEPPTEIEVTFTSADGGTLVEVEHRGWERLSPEFRLSLYDVYVRGWVTTLERFAAAADTGPAFGPRPASPGLG